MARRLVALLTALLMANLTMVGGDIACAKHPGNAAALHPPMSHHQHLATSTERAQNDDAPCRTPSVPVCCQTLTSCAVAIAIAESQPVHRVIRADDSVSRQVIEIPLSQRIAPDPPPPRA